MEILEIKINDIKNLYIEPNHHNQNNQNGLSNLESYNNNNNNGNHHPKYIKLKVGNGRMGSWLKKYSSLLNVNRSNNDASLIDINWNWSFTIKHKPKYQFIFIRVLEDNFLGNMIGECKIDIMQIYNQSLNYPHSIVAPIVSNNGVIGEVHLSIIIHSNRVSSTTTTTTSKSNEDDKMMIDNDQVVPNVSTSKKKKRGSFGAASQMIIEAFKTIPKTLSSSELIHHVSSSTTTTSTTTNNNNNNEVESDNEMVIDINPSNNASNGSTHKQLPNNSNSIVTPSTTNTTTTTNNNLNSDKTPLLIVDDMLESNSCNELVKELRSFLVKEDLKKKSLNQCTKDRLNMVIVQCSGFEDLNDVYSESMISCRVRIGLNDQVLKETTQKQINQLFWKQHFESILSPPLHRYPLNYQMFVVYFYDNSTTPPTLIGQTQEFDLFTLERDKIIELALPIDIIDNRVRSNGTNQQQQPTEKSKILHILVKYSLGSMNEEEAAELLYQCVCANDTLMIDALLQRNVNINHVFRENKHLDNSTYTTPLIKASKHGNIPLVKSLLKLGAQVNYTDPEGYTALMRAVQYEGIFQPSNINIVRILLDSGANPCLKNMYGDDIFKFCNNKDMKTFIQSSIQSEYYELTTVICPRCKYIQFPVCTKGGNCTLKSSNCTCKLQQNCKSCEYPLKTEDEISRIISLSELIYLSRSYNQIKDPTSKITPNYILTCSVCKTFGFLGDINCGLDEHISLSRLDESNIVYLLSHLPVCPIPQPTFIPIWVSFKQIEHLLLFANRGSIRKLTGDQVLQTTKPSFKPFSIIPPELIMVIFSKVNDLQDLYCLSRVNTNFYHLLNDNQFWKSKINNTFTSFEKKIVNNIKSTKLRQQQQIIQLPKKETEEEPVDNSKLFKHYARLNEWIRILLLEETFKPRYTVGMVNDSTNMVVELTLTANKYLFNKDGFSFNFDNQFNLLFEFSDVKQLISVEIIAVNQSVELISDLANLLEVPSYVRKQGITQDSIQRHSGLANIHLKLQSKAINKWINNYLRHMIPGFHSFLMIRDDVGGSIILDFFYYDIYNIELVPKIQPAVDQPQTNHINNII